MKKSTFITGPFKSHKLGFGFVKSNSKKYPFEVFIPKSLTQLAVDGDLVKVKVLGQDEKGYEGEVIEVLERKLKHIAGTVIAIESGSGFLTSPLVGPNKNIQFPLPKKAELRLGDRVIVQLNFKKNSKKLTGKFKSYIGSINEAKLDSECAKLEFNIKESFPIQVLEEVKKLPIEIDPKAYPEREDLQKLTTFTIDPETAKDFDDAISLEKTDKGLYQLGVHIADVSYFVTPGTALDLEASQRCNSTYLPDRCLSMLPKELADNLCSLKPKVPRLAVSTFMVFDHKGAIQNFRITRSIIKSCQRFSYEQVKDILDQKVKHKLYDKLKLLEEAALVLKKAREYRGCVDLSLADSKLMLDKKGIPKGVKVIDYDITHQMIEEFMLKNNEVIAKHLDSKGIPLPFRVHEDPKTDNINNFVQLARSMGLKISSKPKQKELQQLFKEIRGTDLEHQLSVQFIKCMKLAYYSPMNVGHYGLQLEYYTHFTSPIRRYVDLVVHRQLFDPQIDLDIDPIAQKCSDQERHSAKAEASVKDLKLLRYFAKQPKTQTYSGIITKIKPFGLYFEIPQLLYEGFIHVSALGKSYLIFDEKKLTFKSQSGKVRFAIGKKINTKIEYVDLTLREIEWQGA